MSKRHEQLEKTFNLPSLDELNDDEIDELDDYEDDESEEKLTQEELEAKIKSLQTELTKYDEMGEISVKNTEKYNKDIDNLYETARDGYTEIFQAALAMEPAHGAKFLSGATKLLEIALRSKNSSMEKQLDMAKLQLEREKLYNGRTSKPKDIEDGEDGYDTGDYGYGENGGKVYDRNELIDQMKNKNKKDDE